MFFLKEWKVCWNFDNSINCKIYLTVILKILQCFIFEKIDVKRNFKDLNFWNDETISMEIRYLPPLVYTSATPSPAQFRNEKGFCIWRRLLFVKKTFCNYNFQTLSAQKLGGYLERIEYLTFKLMVLGSYFLLGVLCFIFSKKKKRNFSLSNKHS